MPRQLIKLTQKDWKFLEAMCKAGARREDICTALGFTDRSLNNILKREKGMCFKEYREKMRGAGKAFLAAKQFEMAMRGNTAMCIWLGKQWLGQKDTARQVVEIPKSEANFTVTLK